MFCSIIKATNSSFQNGMAFSRSIYVKKVMKLLTFIFEQPSYKYPNPCTGSSYTYVILQTGNNCKTLSCLMTTYMYT